MLFESNGSFGLKANFWPEPFWNDWPRQPIHCETVIVQLAQVNIGANRSCLETGKKVLGLGLDDHAVTNQIQRRLVGGSLPTILGRTGLSLDDGIERLLPGPR